MQRENSMLTFEQSPFLGTANIVGKLQVRQDHPKTPHPDREKQEWIRHTAQWDKRG